MAQRSQPFFRDFPFFLATDEPFLPSAVRTDFGKCAIVRFRLAADAAFLVFFRTAFLCLAEDIFHSVYLREGSNKSALPKKAPREYETMS
jgi:hypothetical protein